MPDFHDPSTREQMEREGWVFTVTPYYLIAQKGPPDGVYVRLNITKHEATIQVMGKMTPAQAIKAANAILEGVEG